MGKEINKLSAKQVATAKEPGRYSDGGGLYLNVSNTGARAWLFMFKRNDRRREMGLGSARDVPLAKARELAAQARQVIIAGGDPVQERQKHAAMTFAEMAAALQESMAPAWRNSKHRAQWEMQREMQWEMQREMQWEMTLRVYCASIATKPVGEVTTEDVLRILKPIWNKKTETASRVRGRIERVLDFAKARGMRDGENPARWR